MNDKEYVKDIIKCFYTRQIEKSRLLIDLVYDINTLDTSGKDLLTESVYTGEIDIVRHILNRGATIRDSNVEDGPVWAACKTGNLEILELLMDHGAKVNIHNAKGQTPLYLAASRRHKSIIRLLLLQGAVLDICTFREYPNFRADIAI